MIEAERARDEVEKDVTGALGEQLPDGRGFALDEAFPNWLLDPLADDGSDTIAVPWTWHGRNEGLFQLAATHREVTLRGITVVTDGGTDLICQRYIDWLPALQEAGIVLYTRPIVASTREFDPNVLEANEGGVGDLVKEIAALRKTFDPTNG